MIDSDAPDIERLLDRTAVRPARPVDPEAVARRARRRTIASRSVAAVAVVAVAVAFGGWIASVTSDSSREVMLDEGPDPDTAPDDDRGGDHGTEEPQPPPVDNERPDEAGARDPATDEGRDHEEDRGDPEAVPEPPFRWVGARVADDEVEVVVHDGPDSFVVARHPLTSPEQPEAQSVSDLAVDAVDAVGSALVGLCCEPGSGAIWPATLEGDDRELRRAETQGHRVSVSGDGTLLATADTHGTVGILPAYPDGDDWVLRPAAGAIDVATDRGAGDRVVALVDSERTAAHTDDKRRGLLVLAPDERGQWEDRFLALDEAACAVAVVADDRVAVVRADEIGEEIGECSGETVRVLDLGDGQQVGEVAFPSPVRHLEVDGTGHHLIAAGDDGAVRWATIDGDIGELAMPDHGEDAGGYVAADW